MLANIIIRAKFKNIQNRKAFFCCVFDNAAASCTITSNVGQVREHSYAMLQCVGMLLTLDIIKDTWPFDV